MFDYTSRYYNLETETHTTPDGRTVTYVRRRFLPRLDTIQSLTEVTVNDGDRLDLITARNLGDPEQFWRVADANVYLNPFDLTAEPGRTVRVPVPSL
ncbi:MAG: hypothetical protein H3C34_21715 [Caldilineaceae bacterium]|nr:hypothetical protein [Caldilineaceae bacterium]